MANPTWVTAVNTKFNGTLDNAVVLKDTGTVKSVVLWDNLSVADQAVLIDAVNANGGAAPLAAVTSGRQTLNFGGHALGANATGLDATASSTAGTATINLGGHASVTTDPSGLGITGNTSGSQTVNFALGTTTTSPTGFAVPTHGTQDAHFSPAIVGSGSASGLAADIAATKGIATVAFIKSPAITPTTVAGIAGTFSFTVNVRGGGAIVYTTATILITDTMATIAAALTTAIGGVATVAATGNAFVVTDAGTAGIASTVVVTLPAGFGTDLVHAINIAQSSTNTNVSVGGITGVSTYTTTVTVDGTHALAISVAGSTGVGDTVANLLTSINAKMAGLVATIGVITPGTGYLGTGTYTNVALTGGTGTGAKATIVVAAGGVSTVTITDGGVGYTGPTDSLTTANTNLGGSGSGFAVLVATTSTYAVATLVSGDILFTSTSTGPASSVLLVTGTLLPSLTSFSVIQAAVQGVGSTAAVTATITVDGTPHAFSVSQSTMLTMSSLVTALQTAIGATSVAVVSMHSSPINTLSAGTPTGGSVYTNGVYLNVPLTGGTGQNAHADITVSGNAVTAVSMVSREGIGYTSGDVLSALSSDIGGTGSGFSFVLTVTTTYSPDISVTSASTGNSSTVSIVDGTLFSSMATFSKILPARSGVTKLRSYSADINVDGSMVAGVVQTLGSITGGTGYLVGSYPSVALTGGTGTGATANIVVSGVTCGAATIALTATPAITPATNLLIAAGVYSFTTNINGAGAATYTVTSKGSDTMTSMAALMTTALGGTAVVTAVGTALVVTSPTLGSVSTVVETIPAASGTDLFGAIYTALTATLTGNTSVAGINAVTSVAIVTGGINFTASPSDVLSVANTIIGGGSGSGFSIPVLTTIRELQIVTVKETGVVGNTYANFVTALSTALSGLATVAITGGNIVITSATTGVASSVTVADAGGLFKALNFYVGIAPTVGVAPTTYTASVVIDGTAHAVSATGNTMQTLTTVVSTLNTAIGAAGTALLEIHNNISTLGTITGGTLYVDGVYHNIPLTGGTGTGALATITVVGGIVTAVAVDKGGTGFAGYTVADSLSTLAINIGSSIATVGTLVGGSLYTNGVYANVPLTGGTGRGATANITVAGNAVTVVTPVLAGVGYTVADVLTAASGNIGGTGSGFTVQVASIVAGSGFSVPVASIVANITITSASTGISSTVLVNDGTLFKNTAGFAGTLASTTGAGGNIATVNTLVGGTGYADGTYLNTPLTGGTGTGATANLTIASGIVTAATLVLGGHEYLVGDVLSATASTIGNTVATHGAIVAGTGYVDGTYTLVPMSGGTGTGAVATIVVSGHVVITVTITAGGRGYTVGDILTAVNNNALIGGAGSGFSVPVATIGGATFSVTVATIVTDLEYVLGRTRAPNGTRLSNYFNIKYVGLKPPVPPYCPHTTKFIYYNGSVWKYLDNDATV
jgi:hypothetical protein